MLKNWIADPDVQCEYGEPVYTTEQAVVKLLNTWKHQYRWAIVLKETSENIGHVSFCRLYEDIATAEIEYCIGKTFWGRGIAAEAVRAFIRHTFQNTSIAKIEAFHRRENPNSGRVLQKSDMLRVDNVVRFRQRSDVVLPQL
jgi:ribosomal-protein-alanine N-acetyltransferase